MDFTWRYIDAAGEQIKPASDSGAFASQADAETWIGETWADLLGEGVEEVYLLEGEQLVYGPMGLRATL